MQPCSTEPAPARTVEYAVVAGFRPLLLDLYRPASPNPVPLVVFLHGGGWCAGRRDSFGPSYTTWDPSPFARLTAAGVAVASVDYRLSGEAIFPAQLDDVAAALDWLRAHAGTLGLDGARIGLWGESAGGHLAALLGLTAGAAGAVRAVVDWYGPSDLVALAADAAASGIAAADPGAPDSRESMLLGAPLPDAAEQAAAASPVRYARSGAPAFLLVHGTADRFVPCAQSRRLADALRGHGTDVRLHLLDGADHLWLGDAHTALTAFELSLAFLLEHLG